MVCRIRQNDEREYRGIPLQTGGSFIRNESNVRDFYCSSYAAMEGSHFLCDGKHHFPSHTILKNDPKRPNDGNGNSDTHCSMTETDSADKIKGRVRSMDSTKEWGKGVLYEYLFKQCAGR